MLTSHHRRAAGALAATTFIILAGQMHAVSAQSLADLANRTAERQRGVAQGRVYTNLDLARDASAAPSPSTVVGEPSTPAPMTPSTQASEAGTAPPDLKSVIVSAPEKNNEPYWRAKAQKVRARLSRTTAGIATAEARLREIDAGPPTPTSIREREVVAVTLARLQREARALDSDLALLITKVPPLGEHPE